MAKKDDEVLIDNVKENIEKVTEETKNDIEMDKDALNRKLDNLDRSMADEISDMGGNKPHLHPTSEAPTSKVEEEED